MIPNVEAKGRTFRRQSTKPSKLKKQKISKLSRKGASRLSVILGH